MRLRRRTTLGKKIRRSLFYFAYLISVVLVAIYFIFWRPFVTELRDRRKPDSNEMATAKHVGSAVVKRLGHVRTKRRSSFVHFSQRKDEGNFRVCAFGDSHTYGDEVNESQDYPSILQGLFSSGSTENVEVLNFGSSAHGFHQAYLMWDLVGRNFDCDYVLLGPSSFQTERDITFNHTGLQSPYYLHSRYVLENGDVRRVDVLGDTHEERFDHYYRFVPHWRYLRYDSNPPAMLQSIVGNGRTLANPFYYHRGTRSEETHETYEILLRKLADSSERIVLSHYKSEIVDLGKRIGMRNLVAVRMYREMRFPYLARKGHSSAMGNRIIAEQFYARIVGGTKRTFTVLKSSDIFEGPRHPVEGKRRSLSSYDRIEVQLGKSPVGFFVSEGRRDSSNLRRTDVDSYLAIKSPDMSVLDAFFLPLEFELPSDAEVVLGIRRSGKAEPHILGRVRMLDARLKLGVVDVEGVEYRKRWKADRLYFKGNEDIPAELFEEGTRIHVSVGGKPILEGRRRGDRILMRPAGDEFHQLRSVEGQAVDVAQLESSGVFDLVLHHPEDGALRVPIARWEKIAVEISRAARSLARRHPAR